MENEVFKVYYHAAGRDEMNGIRHASVQHCLILQVLDGGGSIVMDHRLFPMTGGSVFLIDAGCVHSTSPKYPDRYLRNKLLVPKRFLRELTSSCGGDGFLQELFEANGGLCLPPNGALAEIDRLFAEMNGIPEGQAGTDLLFRADCMKLLYLLSHSRSHEADAPNEKVAELLFAIDRGYTSPVTLDELSREVHTSKFYLSRLFREYTGMSVFTYITERRLGRARELLTTTESPIAAVAGEAGFESISYFCHTFQKYEGMSPSEFRKKSRGSV